MTGFGIRPAMSNLKAGTRRKVGLCWRGIGSCACLLGCALLWSGCESAPVGAEGSIAWVEITNHATTAVMSATRKVFEENAFALTVEEPDRMTFERRGSNWDQLSHGDWGGPVS